MKQTALTQRLLSALMALCMVLSVCAPALAADDTTAIWFQKDSGSLYRVTSGNIQTLLPGYSIAYNGNTVTITMGSGQHTQELEGVTLLGGGQDLVLCTAGTDRMTDTSSSSNIGLTITGMKNLTVTPAEGYSIGFLGSLKIVNCTGDVNLQNSSEGAVDGRLEVDNSADQGSVTIIHCLPVRCQRHTRHHCGRERRHRHIQKDREAGPAGHRPGRKHGGEPLPAVDVYRRSTRRAGWRLADQHNLYL